MRSCSFQFILFSDLQSLVSLSLSLEYSLSPVKSSHYSFFPLQSHSTFTYSYLSLSSFGSHICHKVIWTKTSSPFSIPLRNSTCTSNPSKIVLKSFLILYKFTLLLWSSSPLQFLFLVSQIKITNLVTFPPSFSSGPPLCIKRIKILSIFREDKVICYYKTNERE